MGGRHGVPTWNPGPDPDSVAAVLALGFVFGVAALVAALVLFGCTVPGQAPADEFWRAWSGMTPTEREAVCRNRPTGVDELYGTAVDRFAEACEPYE